MVTDELAEKRRPVSERKHTLIRWSGAVVLFIVAYIHLGLFLNMFTLRLISILFLLNGIGSLIAMIGVMANSKWFGWILGLIMSGGAVVVKIAMGFIPRVRDLLLESSGTSGISRVFPPMGNNFFVGPMGGVQVPHTILPLFVSLANLAIVAVVVELIFIVLATYAHFTMRKSGNK